MIILYVVLMIVLPIGIYLMDNMNTPAKWLIGINTEKQSLSITGDPFSLKEVNFNQYPLLMTQTSDGVLANEVKLSSPTHNEFTIIDKENRKISLVFSILSPSGNQAESVFIRSTFPVSAPRFSINNEQQLLTEKSTYESNVPLKGGTQLSLELSYNKTPPTQKLASFFVASSIGVNKGFHTIMPYVFRSFLLVGRVIFWVIGLVWKVFVFITSSVAKGVYWLVTSAMNHRGDAEQGIKSVASSITHDAVGLAQAGIKGFVGFVIGTVKHLWAMAQTVFKGLSYLVVEAGKILGVLGQATFKGLSYLIIGTVKTMWAMIQTVYKGLTSLVIGTGKILWVLGQSFNKGFSSFVVEMAKHLGGLAQVALKGLVNIAVWTAKTLWVMAQTVYKGLSHLVVGTGKILWVLGQSVYKGLSHLVVGTGKILWVLGQSVYKGLAYLVIGTGKILWVLGQSVYKGLAYLVIGTGKILWVLGQSFNKGFSNFVVEMAKHLGVLGGAVFKASVNIFVAIGKFMGVIFQAIYKGLSYTIMGTIHNLGNLGRIVIHGVQFMFRFVVAFGQDTGWNVGQAWRYVSHGVQFMFQFGIALGQDTAWNAGQAWQYIAHGGEFMFQLLVALGQDATWNVGQVWRSIFHSSQLEHVNTASKTEKIVKSKSHGSHNLFKLSFLMRLPREPIGVAESVTIDFFCIDYQGNPAANRAVNVRLKSSIQTDYILLSPDSITTDVSGRFSIRLKTGREASIYHLNLLCDDQKFHARIDAFPTKPVQMVSVKDQLTFVAPIGTLMKDAFQIKVYDRFQNPVPFAKVDWYTLLPGVTDSVKFLEARTDRKGYLKMDYRMDDLSRTYWVQAHLVGTTCRLNYNMQSLAVNPENMVPFGDEDRQIIVGTPLKKPFIVKVTDHFDNPVPNIVVAFTLQDDQQEDVIEKEVRTNRKGFASIRLNTPKKTGDYSLLVSSETLPDADVGFTISVQPGNVASVVRVTGNAQSAYWGQLASKPLRIRVTDSLGNPIAGLPVEWKGDPELAWDEVDPETDEKGYASAKVGTKKTPLKILHPLAEVAGQKVYFDLFPKETAVTSLYLTSSPVIKVLTGKMLPADIALVLRDQYSHVLVNKTIELEYMVKRLGVTYQQKLSAFTNKSGLVTFNFAVSDQKDEINVKAKYFDGKDTIITWIKVDVVPSGISRLVVLPESIQSVVGQKIDRPVRLLLIDQKGLGMPGIPLDVVPYSAPGDELKTQKGLRQKTNQQGVVYFFPLLGKTAGDYIYQVKMMNEDNRFTVRAIAGQIRSLSIRPPKQHSVVVGSITRGFMVRALDQFGNPAVGKILMYGVGDANMKAKVGLSGYARLVVVLPKSASTYKLKVTDEDGSVKTEMPIHVHESVVGSVRWMGDASGFRARAGASLHQDFPCQIIDAYGNALSNVKMSLDVYDQKRTTTLLSVGGESKTGGEGRFSLTAPKRMGHYWGFIYPSDSTELGTWVTFDVAPTEVESVQIVTGDNQRIHAGNQAPIEFTLLMKDRFGNPVSGQDVNWVYQVKLGSDSRYLNTVTKTNAKGVAVFNVVMDKEPGVRELKAYFLRQGKKDKQSFYYKILSNEVTQFQILSGRDQKVNPGRQLPQAIRVHVMNRSGAPIGNAVVRFDIESTNPAQQGQLLGLTVHTNAEGIASAFLISPSLKGKYKIKTFVANDPKMSDVALLTVL